MRESLTGRVLASTLRNPYLKKYAIVYPNMPININAKQVTLIHAAYFLQKNQVKGRKQHSATISAFNSH